MKPASRSHPAVRNYLVFCLVALVVLTVCLTDRGLDWFSFVPALAGILTLMLNWSFGPPLVLMSLGFILGGQRLLYPPLYVNSLRYQSPKLMDLLLCVAALTYAVGHYRTLALLRQVFPSDPRGTDPTAASTRRRAADLVTSAEFVLLVFFVSLWTLAAMALWIWLSAEHQPPLNLTDEAWRLLRLLWLFLGVALAVGVAATYRRWTTATPEESLLYLQDVCWSATRRDQSHINRRLAKARLSGQRKKEKT